MAMGKRRRKPQSEMWIPAREMPCVSGHPFYERLNAVLGEHGFDVFVEELCGAHYAEKMGRPSIPPAAYFRMLLVGYFEGIDSERGIAWRCADSLALREFLGYELSQATPDHSSVSRTRRRLDLEAHREVFTWVLRVLAQEGLLTGKTVGVDASTLEANAALRSIVRRDTGASYEEFLVELAKASGIATPTRADLAKVDRKRPRKGSNDDWQHPHDPDARITKMKDGRTHLAHKAEHAVDLETGAVMAVTVQAASDGDTKTLMNTVMEAAEQLERVREDESAAEQLSGQLLKELIVDKGYHSNEILVELSDWEIRTYASEPDRGRRRWKGETQVRDVVYANRRRIRGERGKWLLRLRGELLERPFAHYLDRGGMRRVHLRGGENIWKRLLVHVAGFNLGLVMRQMLGHGTPRGLRAARKLCYAFLWAVWSLHKRILKARGMIWRRATAIPPIRIRLAATSVRPRYMSFATGC
jgi:transposase